MVTVHNSWRLAADNLDLLLLCLVPLAAIATAWFHDRVWLTVCCTWIGFVAGAVLSLLVARALHVTPTYARDDIGAIFHFALIGWFPGLLIHGAVAIVKTIWRKLRAFGGRTC